jgi:hypothetical protein
MYGLPASTQRPASNLYPSIQSNAPTGTGENYYTGSAAPSTAYGQAQPSYGGGYQSPYPQFDKRASVPPPSYAPPQEQYQQPSQPYPNLAQRPPSTTYQHPASPQLQRQVSNQQYPPHPSSAYPPQAPPSTVSDAESASYYYGDNNAPQPSQAPLQRTQSYGSQPSHQQQQQPPQQTPTLPQLNQLLRGKIHRTRGKMAHPPGNRIRIRHRNSNNRRLLSNKPRLNNSRLLRRKLHRRSSIGNRTNRHRNNNSLQHGSQHRTRRVDMDQRASLVRRRISCRLSRRSSMSR